MQGWFRFFALACVAPVACGRSGAPEPPTAPLGEAEPEVSEDEHGVSGNEGEGDESAFAPAPPGSARGGAALVAEASRVLSTMTASTYSHRTHIDGTVYEVDCSGFADYLLSRTAAPALDELRAATVKRPLAKHFVQFFQKAKDAARWQPVPRVSELAPGDVLAWKKPADLTNSNTGHVMIVAAPPSAQGAVMWMVPILDSTASPHGKGDSRKASHATGVGRGVVLVEVDASGAPVAYRWSDGKKAHRHVTEIAMGRLK